MGDEPTPSSSFHTQTLTQMSRRSAEKSPVEEDDIWQFQPSDDEVEQHPTLPSANDQENRVPGEKVPSRAPSAVPQTPTNKRIIFEIPSSQGSPLTPMLARYSPAPRRSPLKDRSTNTKSPMPKFTGSVKRPRTLTVQDSFATNGSQSSTQHYSPTKAPLQPAKNVRFITPHPTASLAPMEEEEEETEGEESDGRDVSPSPRRTPGSLYEIADSEDESDDLEILDEEAEGYDAVGEETQFQMDQLLTSSEEKQASKEASPSEEDDSDKENVAPAADEEEEATLVLSKPFVLPKLARLDSGGSDRRETVEVITSSPDPTRNSDTSVPIEVSGESNEESISETPTQSQITPKARGKATLEIPKTPKTPHTQGLESQRIPMEVIRGMGPQSDRTDIFISIHPNHMENIVAGTKNHEFRAYKIPNTVSRMWLYITKPASELRYMACISEAKVPGEIDEDGIGNDKFNQRKSDSKFAYRLYKVYELNDPVPLHEMKERDWLHGAPQKYNYVPPAVVGQLMANLRCSVFGDDEEEEEEAMPEPEIGRKEPSQAAAGPSQDRTVSQELADQIRIDIEHSTQHHSSDADLLVPSSQTPTRKRRKFGTELHFTKPALPPTPLSRPSNPTPRRAVRSSQATTVSQTSSPSQSPVKSVPRPMHADSSLPIFVDDEDDSPIRLPPSTFQLDSSQLLSRSQMLPESLLREERSDIVYDSDRDDEL